MRRIKNFFFTVLVSPETLFFAAIVASHYFWPTLYSELGNKIKKDAEIWKYLPTISFGFTAIAYTFSSKIRAPLENFSNKLLYGWGDYDLLVDRVYAGLFVSTLSSIAALTVWVFGEEFSLSIIGALTAGAILVSGAVALTMLFAHQRLRELIELHS